MASKSIISIIKEAGGEQDEVAAASAFQNEGIRDLEDLSESTDPGKKIDEVLAKTNLSQVKKDALKTALLAALKKEQQTPPPKEPANVPSGKAIEIVIKSVAASDDEKAKVIAAFQNAGIIEVAKLNDEKPAPDTMLDRVLNDSTLAIAQDKVGAFRSALKSAWQAENKTGGGATGGTAPPTDDVKVPAGAVDVTSISWPTLKAETAASIATFKVPEIFAAANTPFVAPSKVLPYQWLHLARSNNLTTALNLRKLLNPNSPDAHATKPAFLWKRRSGDITDTSKAKSESRVSTTIEEGQAYEHMMADASIAGQYAFCEASVKASYKMDTERRSYSKILHLRARWQQDRCKLVLENCLIVAPVFKHLIDVGLDSTKIKSDEQFDYFSQLFDKFGHVVPEAVYLGGILEIQRDLMSIEQLSKDTVKERVDSSVTAKINKEVGGSAQIGYSTDKMMMQTVSNSFEHLAFTSIGGDPSKQSDPQQWISSTNNPELWKIIYRENMKPITDWLELQQRKQIDQIVEKKRREAWQTPLLSELMKQDGGDCDLPPNRSLPFFPQDHHVTLRQWTVAYNDLQEGEKVYLQAKNGTTDVVDAGGTVEDGKDTEGHDCAPGDPRRASGSTYANCQPAPKRADRGDGDSPDPSGLLWRIVYTGQCTSDHEPMFWIVTKDDKWALSAFRHPNYITVACLMPFDEAKRLRTKKSPPRWVLRTAIPPGRLTLPPLPDNNSAYFRIYNPWSEAYLADLATASSYRKYIKRERRWVQVDLRGGYWKDVDIPMEGPGPDFQTTVVRTETESDLKVVTEFQSAGATYYIQREGPQQRTYQTRCWLIQDRTKQTEKGSFSQLENSYIDNWIEDYQSRLKEVST